MRVVRVILMPNTAPEQHPYLYAPPEKLSVQEAQDLAYMQSVRSRWEREYAMAQCRLAAGRVGSSSSFLQQLPVRIDNHIIFIRVQL